MSFDTATMRKLLADAPGDRMAMAKVDIGAILDAVDEGETAKRTLANMRAMLGGASQAIAA